MNEPVIPAAFSFLLFLFYPFLVASQSTSYYSITNGNWETPSTWSTVSHSGVPALTAPGSGSTVYIGDGSNFFHVITVTANNAGCDSLTLSSGSVLDLGVTTGHHFAIVTSLSKGSLRISSGSATAQFPAGQFSPFLGSAGGTVEYYSSTRSFTLPIITASPTAAPITGYNYLIVSVATDKGISLGNSDLEIWHDMTVKSTDATTAVKLNNASESAMVIHGHLQILSGKLLFMNWNNDALTLTVDSNITVASGATFTVDKNGPGADNTLIIGGSLINNGTFDMSSEQAFRAYPVVFTGSSDATISGTGPVTDFFALHVNKGSSSSSMLDVTSSAFSFSNNQNPLILFNGTFRLTSPLMVTVAADTFAIPSTTRLSANGGIISIAPAGDDADDVKLAGTLEITAGSICIGDSMAQKNNDIIYASTGSPAIDISGGSLYVNGQIRRSTSLGSGSLTYSQSGNSIVRIFGQNGQSGFAQLEVVNPGSTFNMSGGTLTLVRGSSTSVSDLLITPTFSTVTGGTVIFGASATETINQVNTFTLESSVHLNHITVNGTTNPKTVTLQTHDLNLGGNLLIEATSSFIANSLNLSISGNLTNQNSSAGAGLATGGFQPGSVIQTTTFEGSEANQSITGVNGNLTNFGNLVITNTSQEGTLSIQPNTAIHVLGNLSIAGTSTLAASGNDPLSVCKNWINNGAYHHNNGTVRFTGSTQEITGSSSNLFFNITIGDTSTTTMVTAGQQLIGVLLCDGTLNGDEKLTLLSTASQTALIDGEGDGEVTGIITMQRYLPSGFGYKYFSSPFQDATVADFADDMDLTASFPTFYAYIETDTASGWDAYTGITNPLVPLNGYAVNFGPEPAEKTVDISGTVNNGLLDILTLYNHNETFTLGFNLLGNPYPSPIDWDAPGGWIRTNIDDAIYLFNAGTTNQYTGTYSSYVNGISSDGIASRIIPSMQGFFVHVTDGIFPVTGSIQSDNRIRTNDASPVFHKSTDAGIASFLRVTAAYGVNQSQRDPVAIRFADSATWEFDRYIDALKLMNTDLSVPNFYALTPSASRLSIQSVPFPSAGNPFSIALGILTESDDLILFDIPDVSPDIGCYYVYLRDAAKGICHRLGTGQEYAVYLKAGCYNDRFSLMLSNSDLRFIPDNNPPFYAYARSNRIYLYVNLGQCLQATIILHSLTGQRIMEIPVYKTGYYEYSLNVSPAMYIVTLYMQDGFVDSKKIVISSR